MCFISVIYRILPLSKYVSISKKEYFFIYIIHVHTHGVLKAYIFSILKSLQKVVGECPQDYSMNILVILKKTIYFLFNSSVMKPHYCYLVHNEKNDNRPTSTELWKEFKNATTSHGIPHVNNARGKILPLV